LDDLEFRRRVLSGDTHSEAVEQAAQQDTERQRWLAQARALEAELTPALTHSPPQGLADRLKQIPVQNQPRRRQFSVAAAAILVLALSTGLLFYPTVEDELGDAVLNHISAEPASLYNREPVTPATVSMVAGRLGYQFTTPQRGVSYAGTCAVRGQQAVHLTVQRGNSSASLFLLPAEPTRQSHNFSANHLHGRIVPLQKGSAAIISSNPALLDQLEAETLSQLSF